MKTKRQLRDKAHDYTVEELFSYFLEEDAA